ncbi:T9SS C-terminal target domain-containing protein [Chryseobacterium cucumeris]|uniref:T9SS C-terminal target domain-containing protein n=1 Tax=Chryseobacterium cucumeris TaxID=1813611 RepID=A0ABX9X6N3_9FLAO|nr:MULTISPECIES: T9SS type A sorting domain-containing protein [Chryseobacterium]QWT84638.1 T9SS type A sorting domain-containing protein [Chryseobacterium sp. PCH239]ROH92587.1 T9SS C-terminal target domain-containing protein [Chryseobacterium cucumeris]
MKTKLLFISLISFVFGNAQILTETFQGTTFPPTGWTTGTNVASRPWGFTTTIFNATGQATFNINGGKSAAIGWIAQAQDAHLTSPSFSLVGTTSPVLKFNAKIGYEYMVDPNPNGDLKVEVSTDGGTTWNQVWVEENYGVYTDYETLAITVSLASYAGQANVKFRFHYVANDADSLSIDDVQVLASATLATQESNAKVKEFTNIYPNPTKGEINIKTDKKIKSTTVIDASGKSLLNNTSERLDISSLPKGVYLLKVDFSDGTSKTEKVIKQ